MRPGKPRTPCQHCRMNRKLKTVTVAWKGETRQIDVCRPCAQAIKAAIESAKAA